MNTHVLRNAVCGALFFIGFCGIVSSQNKACKVSDINVQRNFDIHRFTGRWFDVARVYLSGRDSVQLSSAVSNYTLRADGSLGIEYGGEINGRCIRPLVGRGVQQTSNFAKLSVQFDDAPDAFLRGDFWVIETNYNYAMIYGCYLVSEDGTCDANNEMAYIISRRKLLGSQILQRALQIVRHRLCIDTTRLKVTKQKVTCPPDPDSAKTSHGEDLLDIVTKKSGEHSTVGTVDVDDTPSLLITAADHSTETDARGIEETPASTMSSSDQEMHTLETTTVGMTEKPVKNCKIESFRTQRNMDWQQFAGTWYTVSQIRSPNRQHCDSGRWIIEDKKDGKFQSIFISSRSARCLQPVRTVWTPSSDGTGNLQISYGNGVQGSGKIVYTDIHQVALYYECTRPESDGTCKEVNQRMEVLQRVPEASGNLLLVFRDFIEDLCLDPNKLELVVQDVKCQVDRKCYLDDIVVAENLDIAQFVGKWKVIAKKVIDDTFEMREVIIVSGHHLSATYSALRQNKCQSRNFVTLKSVSTSNRTGDYEVHYDNGGKTGILKITYTDPNFAMIYICDMLVSEHGSRLCRPENIHVFMLGRGGFKHLNNDEEFKLKFANVFGTSCLTASDMTIVKTEDACPVLPIPFSKKIDDLPTAINFDISNFLGIWYGSEVTGHRSLQGVIKLNFLSLTNGQLELLIAVNNNGTCRPTSKHLVTSIGNSKTDWKVLLPNGRTGHFRFVSANELELNFVYFCSRLQTNGLCRPESSHIYVLSRTPYDCQTVKQTATKHAIYPVLKIAGFEIIASPDDASCDTAVDCSALSDDDQCPLDSFPTAKKLHFNKLLGTWYVLARLKNSPNDLDSAELRLNPGEVTAISYTGTRNKTCEQALKGKLTRFADRVDASYGLDFYNNQTGSTPGTMIIVWTDYRHALVYQCWELDATKEACLPGKTSVEVWSRRRDINRNLKAQLLQKTQNLCIDPTDVVDLSQEDDCSTAPNCYIEEFPKAALNLQTSDLVGNWNVVMSANQPNKTNTSIFDGMIITNNNKFYAVGNQIRNGVCTSHRKQLVFIDNDITQMYSEFQENNVVFRILDVNGGTILLYHCEFVETSRSCSPGMSHAFILVRDGSRQSIPEDLLAHFSDLIADVCLDGGSGEFTKTANTQCLPSEKLEDKTVRSDCDSHFLKHPNISIELLPGEWYRVGVLQGHSDLTGLKYRISTVESSPDISIQYAAASDSNCLLAQKKVAKLISQTSFYTNIYDRPVELDVLYVDDDLLILEHCFEMDSLGRCLPNQNLIEVLTRNESVPDFARQRLSEMGWCSKQADLTSDSDTVDCSIEIEPECSIEAPPMRSVPSLEKVSGSWHGLASRIQHRGYRINSAEIQLQDDQTRMIIHFTESNQSRCLPTTKTVLVNSTEDNYRWSIQSNVVEGEMKLVYVDDRHLVFYECIGGNGSSCLPGNAFVDVLSRSRSPPTDQDLRKLTIIMRRICFNLDEFVYTFDEEPCRIDVRQPTVGCELGSFAGSKTPNIRFLTGRWIQLAELRGSSASNNRILEISSTKHPDRFKTNFVGSRRGRCLSNVEVDTTFNTTSDNLILGFHFEPSNQSDSMVVLHLDHRRYLVTMECYVTSEDKTCTLHNADVISIYSRFIHQMEPSVVESLIFKSGLAGCFEQDDFNFVTYEVNCPMLKRSCQLLSGPYVVEFTSDKLIGSWNSLYHYDTGNNMESYTIRFHRTGDSGKIMAFHVGSSNGVCQEVGNFSVDFNHEFEWRLKSEETDRFVKISFVDANHIMLYQCDREKGVQNLCKDGSLSVNVLVRDKITDSDSENIVEKMARVLQTVCIETGNMKQSDSQVLCQLPVLKKTGCTMKDLPVVDNLNYNKVGGVWYSLQMLTETKRVDNLVLILQPMNANILLAIFRASRTDECLHAQTATMTSMAGSSHTANFDAKYRTYSGKFKILYADYDYMLSYECSDQSMDDDQCPANHRHAVIYGRVREERIPDGIKDRIFEVANEACFYEDEFETSKPAVVECDLPFSGRHSCRLEDVLVEDPFDISSMFGSWRLLASTTQLAANVTAESLRFSLGIGGISKYSWMSENSQGLCQRHDGTLDRIATSNATFTYFTNRQAYDLMAVVYMNAQYLILYVCRNVSQSEVGNGVQSTGTCPDDRQEVKIYGRTTVLSSNVLVNLVDIVSPRTCVGLTGLSLLTVNSKCDLPPDCEIQDFIVQENFDSELITGTWQALMKSTFRRITASPSTAKFVQLNDGSIRIVKVTNTRSDGCEDEEVVLKPTGEVPGVYQTDEHSSTPTITLMLYATEDYFVSLDCIGSTSGGGDCTSEKVELTIWGRTWRLDQVTKRMILGELRDRTLRCYAMHALVDVDPNDVCQMPAGECSMNNFELQKDFDGRQLLGSWYSLSRSQPETMTSKPEDIRVALSGQTYHVTQSGTDDSFECYETSGLLHPYSGRNATFMTVQQNAYSLVSVVHLDSEALVLMTCIGVISHYEHCPSGVSVVEILTRKGDMNDDEKLELIRTIRLRLRSCVATDDLRKNNFADKICPMSPPQEGSENCNFNRLPVVQNLQQISGLWFQVMRTNRVSQIAWEAGMLYADVMNFPTKFYFAGYERSGCVVDTLDGRPTKNTAEWKLSSARNTNTLKVVYIGGEYMMTYECFESRFKSHGMCAQENEHLTIYSRRRYINTVDRKTLVDTVARETCFGAAELTDVLHSVKCPMPASFVESRQPQNRVCFVDNYTAIENFDKKKFAGLWHEIESTRYSSPNHWESGIFNFSSSDSDSGAMSFIYSGSRDGQCIGSVYGEAVPTDTESNSADFSMWTGVIRHPWTVQIRFKIIYTDYFRYAIVYICQSVDDRGICRQPSEQVLILGRNGKINDSERISLYGIVSKGICADMFDFVPAAREAQCHSFVERTHGDPVHSGAQSRSAHESQPIEEVVETKVQTSSSIQRPIAEPESNKGSANQQPNAEEDMQQQPTLAGPVEDVAIEHIHQPVNQQPDGHICPIPWCMEGCSYVLNDQGCETCICADIPDSREDSVTESTPGTEGFHLKVDSSTRPTYMEREGGATARPKPVFDPKMLEEVGSFLEEEINPDIEIISETTPKTTLQPVPVFEEVLAQDLVKPVVKEYGAAEVQHLLAEKRNTRSEDSVISKNVGNDTDSPTGVVPYDEGTWGEGTSEDGTQGKVSQSEDTLSESTQASNRNIEDSVDVENSERPRTLLDGADIREDQVTSDGRDSDQSEMEEAKESGKEEQTNSGWKEVGNLLNNIINYLT